MSRVAGLMVDAAKAYDREDSDWFARQPTDALAALWGAACVSEYAWDDEVYDELDRRGWFDHDAGTEAEGDDYLVTWQINVDAEDESGESWGAANPTEAAMRAGIILMGASHLADRMADPDAATVFDVTDRRTGATTRVDLSDNNEREV